MAPRPRCLVVGAGLLGLSAAWSLSRRGWDAVVLEAAAAPGHPRAGSKGDARIFRLGYPDPLYVDMAARAGVLWRALQAESGRTLLRVTGQVTFGDELPAIAAALAGSGAPFERLAPGETRTRFPGLAVEAPALFEPDSGVLAADEVLRALGQTGSFVLRTGAEVMAVTGDGAAGGVALTLRDGETMRADVAVLCAGPRTLRLLGHSGSEAVAAPAALPQVAYFAATPGSASLPPVFIEWGADMIYGLPVAGRGAHAGTYKVSHHTPEGALDEFDPTDRAAFEDDPTLLAVLTEATRRLLPGLDPRPVATERCVYDNSADTDFVLDRVGPVVVGCGTSGHGFKFGPLLGELLADLSEGTAPAVDLSRFSLSRRPAGAGH